MAYDNQPGLKKGDGGCMVIHDYARSLKILPSIVITLSGISIFFKELHSSNAPNPISSKELLNVIFSRLLHLLKAHFPIFIGSFVFEKDTVFKPVHPLNADDPIDVKLL